MSALTSLLFNLLICSSICLTFQTIIRYIFYKSIKAQEGLILVLTSYKLNKQKWWKPIFLLQYQYSVNQTGEENKMMYCQILSTYEPSQERAYPGFCSMKREMPVQSTVIPSIKVACSSFIHLWREAPWEYCLAQEYRAVSLASAQTRTARSKV